MKGTPLTDLIRSAVVYIASKVTSKLDVRAAAKDLPDEAEVLENIAEIEKIQKI